MIFNQPGDFTDFQRANTLEQGRVFKRIFATLFVVVLLILPLVWPILQASPLRRALVVTAQIITGSAWLITHFGRLGTARALIAGGYWLVVTILIVDSGGLASPWLMTQLVITGLSALLLSRRLALVLGVLSIGVDTGLYFLQDMLPTLGVAAQKEQYLAAVLVNFVLVGAVVYYTGAILARSSQSAREQERRYRSLFDKTNDAVFLVGMDFRNIEANEKGASLLGYEVEEMRGMHIDRIVAPEERANAYNVAERLESENMLPVYERTMVRKDGSRLRAEVNAALIRDEQGKPLYIQSVVRDISERKRLEEQLKNSLAEMEDIAMSDPLTGLLNRRAINDYAEAEWHRSRRQQRAMCLVLIDLDNLKDINDEFGHHVGDEALLTLAKALKQAKRPYDWMGRWGGDEFLMVLPDTNLVQAEEVALRLHSLIENLRLGEEGGKAIHVKASIGLSVFSGREGDELTLEGLLGQADRALYQAKEAGRNRISVYRD